MADTIWKYAQRDPSKDTEVNGVLHNPSMEDVVPPWLVKKECQCGQPGVGAEPVTTEKKENEPVVKTEMEVDDGVVAVLKLRDNSGMFSLLWDPALRVLADSLFCAFA